MSSELAAIPVSLFGEPYALPMYILVVDFTKPVWFLTTYFIYSFYPSIHRTQRHHSTTQFIHAILFGQPIDINQVIFYMMVIYSESSHPRSLLITMIISQIIMDTDFEIH